MYLRWVFKSSVTRLSADLFVHFSEFKNPTMTKTSLIENDKVNYEIGNGQKGPQAINVKVEK